MVYSNGQDDNACSCMDGSFLQLKPASRRASFCSPEPEWTLIQVTFLSHMVYLLIIRVSTLCGVVHRLYRVFSFEIIFIGSISP